MIASDRLDQLLLSFRALAQRATRPRTLLQIAGVAHLEAASSNVLAFYLDPESGHGLGTLLLDALLAFLPGGPQAAENVRVRREVQTSDRNRLDLVISSDRFVLGVENKINHSVINPFDDYWTHLDSLSAGRAVYGIILSYQPVAPSTTHHGFVPVSYRDYFARVTDTLDSTPVGNEPYVGYLRDFIRTMDDPNEERMLDMELVQYLTANRGDVEALLRAVNQFHAMSKRKLRLLEGELRIRLQPDPPGQVIEGAPALYNLLSYKVQAPEGLLVGFNINLSPDGWNFNLLNYAGDSPAQRAALTAGLNAMGILTFVRQEHPWRLETGETPPYDADIALVTERAVALLQQLKLGDVS